MENAAVNSFKDVVGFLFGAELVVGVTQSKGLRYLFFFHQHKILEPASANEVYIRLYDDTALKNYSNPSMTHAATTDRKNRLEERLASHGITGTPITYLPYLELNDDTFASPFESGCRMMILYALAYTASQMDDREKIVQWLKKENLWTHVSPNEKEFFEGNVTDEQQIIDFSWEGEGAYILAWALNVIKETPTPTEPVTEEQLTIFSDAVPALGTSLHDFLSHLSYRDAVAIYDENLFHELATTYFRNLLFNGKEDESDMDRGISFKRHRTLNWLRRFSDIEDWDETDTST